MSGRTEASSPAVVGADVRDTVLLAVNGVVHEVCGAHAFGTLSGLLRDQLRLTGTKIVCSEGDCGACSVLAGELTQKGTGQSSASFQYRAIDSCIGFVYQFDCCHIITVDGLAQVKHAQRSDHLHPVQRAMAENYGSQCGFCTPGFVVAITDLVDDARREGRALKDQEVRTALSGNLCRCTGYVQILDAVASIDLEEVPAPNELFDELKVAVAFREARAQSLRIEHDGCSVLVPATAEQALAQRAAHPQARVVAGATDLGVRFNKGQLTKSDWLHLGRDLEGFAGTSWDEETGQMVLGATVRWRDALDHFDRRCPEFAGVLRRFGGPQIRNMGTVGGNVMNASPIADALPFFHVADAHVELVSETGSREVAVEDFYLGYKTFDLAPNELLRSVRLSAPVAAKGERVFLLKASRRRDLDISTFTGALWLQLEGSLIVQARMAYGGVGPVVLRLPRSEAALRGQSVDRSLFEQVGAIAATEITPISDVRGAAAYRELLARNTTLRFYEQLESELKAAEECAQ